MTDRQIFNMIIAGVKIRAAAQLPSTLEYCKEYVTGEDFKPDIFAEVTPELIGFIRKDGEADERDKGLAHVEVPQFQAELLALHKAISDKMPAFGRALFHSSAVAVNGQAVLFTAPSGTGKSTHARLWKKLLGERLVSINDDKPFIGFDVKDGKEQPLSVYGSPWMGKHRIGANTSAPIKAVCLINRSDDNRVEKADPLSVFASLFNQTYRPRETEMLRQTMLILKKLAEEVPVYNIYCNMEPDAAKVAYETIFG